LPMLSFMVDTFGAAPPQAASWIAAPGCGRFAA